jgi:hypothetical protein
MEAVKDLIELGLGQAQRGLGLRFGEGPEPYRGPCALSMRGLPAVTADKNGVIDGYPSLTGALAVP